MDALIFRFGFQSVPASSSASVGPADLFAVQARSERACLSLLWSHPVSVQIRIDSCYDSYVAAAAAAAV